MVAASVLALLVSEIDHDVVMEAVDVEGALIVETVDRYVITAGLFVIFGVTLKFVVKKVTCGVLFSSVDVFFENSELDV